MKCSHPIICILIYVSVVISALIFAPRPGLGQEQIDEMASDAITNTAIRLSLTNDWYELQQLYQEVRRIEQVEFIASDQWARQRSYIQDNVLDLYAATVAADRDELERALKKAREFQYRDIDSMVFDTMAKQKITNSTLKNMKRRIFFSRFASVFNRLGKAVSQVFSLQTIVILQLPVDLVYSVHRTKIANPMERKLLFQEKVYYRKGGFIENELKFKKGIDKLEAKRNRAFVLQDLERGKQARKNGDLLISEFYYSKAANRERNYKYEKASKLRDEVLREMRDNARRREASNILYESNKGIQQDEEGAENEETITELLAAGQWEESSELAHRWASEDPVDAPLDDIELIDAISAYSLGYKARADAYFKWISRHFKNESAGIFSREIMKSPQYYPSIAVKDAKAEFRSDTYYYIMYGHPLEDYAYISATQAAALQPAWVQNVAFLFVIDSAVRGIGVMIHNPISRDKLIDKIQIAYRQIGIDQNSDPYIKDLRKNYEKARIYDQAVFYATLEGLSPRRIQKLKDKEVEQLYRSVLQVRDVELRLYLLKRIQKEYPGSVVYEQIEASINKLTEAKNVEAHMDKKEFRRWIGIFNDTCFYFDPTLVDGIRDNGEMSRDGITLKKDKTLVFHEIYVDETKMIPLSNTDYDKIMDFFKLYNRMHQMAKARRSSEQAEKAYLELRGGIGGSGAELYPGISPVKISDEDKALFE